MPSDLQQIFGGPFVAPLEVRQVAPPEEQFRRAIEAAGLDAPDVVEMDGRLHRWTTGSKGKPGNDKSGWYILFGDGVPAGRWGDWRLGIDHVWKAEMGRKLSAVEEMAHVRRMAESRALRDAELARTRQIAADTVEAIWAGAAPASSDHPYLRRKGIGTHGARVTGDGRLVVPLYAPDGALSSLQYIDADGNKLYHTGSHTSGRLWMIGSLDEPGPLYVAEGFATAATIHEATHRPCVVAYSASNIVPVVGTLREAHGPMQDIVIVADHDRTGVGQKYADQACAKHGARMVMPPIEGMDANDWQQAGHDLLGLLNPPATDWLIPADLFSAQPAPISWLIKGWVQDQSLIMVHGPSGGGKTFIVLDWCLRMASGMTDWCGHRVRPADIVYLAGEGHHGLRGRIAAWKHHHQQSSLSMWLSRAGCDLNTSTGYAQVAEQVRLLPKRPSLIVVDTLHRFLAGDENSAQDAKTMLDACASLMAEFSCSVLLVHHTGVSDEAQHRARGSSAWRGALDIEVSIVPAKDDQPMQIIQRKSKDAELAQPLFARLHQVIIPGWIDEDNLPVTSAVPVQQDAPISNNRKDSKLDMHRKTFERAWWSGGAELRDGSPYLSRSALKDQLTQDGRKPRTIENDISPSYPDRLIGALTLADVIQPYEHGWIVIDGVQSSAMRMARAEAP